MTEREQKLLGDIRDALNEILLFTRRIGLNQFLLDRHAHLIVERLLLIVGEAASRLRRESPETAARINHLRGAVWLRNFIVHAYDSIDVRIIWQTISEDAEPLLAEVNSLLADRGPQ